MQCDINTKSKCSNFSSIIVLIVSILMLVSVLSKAQDKKEHQHDKMKMEKTEKTHCSDEAGMSCCSEKKKVSEVSDKPWNEVCPVLGNKINKKVKTVVYEEKAYGFCCAGCDTKFEKEPSKFSKNLSDEGKKFVGKKS